MQHSISQNEAQQHSFRIYLVGVTLLTTAVVNVIAITHALLRPEPRHPWEAGLVVESYRVSQSLPLYEKPESGHATWMYGPLSPLMVGQIFKITGANNYAGRSLSIICSLILFTLIATWTCKDRDLRSSILTFALLLTVHTPSLACLTESRPDLPAALCGTMFLGGYYAAIEKKSYWMVLPALVSLVIAVLFKQTMVVFCVIPGIAIFRASWHQFWKSLMLLSLPCITLMLTLGFISNYYPNVFFYLVEVPRAFSLHFNPTKCAILIGVYFPIAAVLYIWNRNSVRLGRADKAKARWIESAIFVTAGASLLMVSKRGGASNSYLLPWVAVIAYIGLHYRLIEEKLTGGGSSEHRREGMLLAVVFSFSIICTLLIDAKESAPASWSVSLGDSNYDAVISRLREFPGEVTCLDDPTISLYSKGLICRNITLEVDAAGWPRSPLPYVLQDLTNARLLVRVDTVWSQIFNHGWLDDTSLRDLGFAEISLGLPAPTVYSFWIRDAELE